MSGSFYFSFADWVAHWELIISVFGQWLKWVFFSQNWTEKGKRNFLPMKQLKWILAADKEGEIALIENCLRYSCFDLARLMTYDCKRPELQGEWAAVGNIAMFSVLCHNIFFPTHPGRQFKTCRPNCAYLKRQPVYLGSYLFIFSWVEFATEACSGSHG